MAEDRQFVDQHTHSQDISGNADVVGPGPGVGPLSVSANAATEAARQQGIADSGLAADSNTRTRGPSALPASDAASLRDQDLRRVQPGWLVYGSDGELLGPAGAVSATHLTISRASRMGRDMFIPEEFIETVANQRVVLSRPKQLLLDMKLDEGPVPESLVETPHEAGLSAESAQGPTRLSTTGINAEGLQDQGLAYTTGAPQVNQQKIETAGTTRFVPKSPHEPMPAEAGGRPTKIRALNIQTGWRIVDETGTYVGIVDGFTEDSLKLIQTTNEEQFLPLEAIASAGDGVVHLGPAPAPATMSAQEGQRPDYAPAAPGVDEGNPTPPTETSAGEPRIGLTSPIERTPDGGYRDTRRLPDTPPSPQQPVTTEQRFGEAGYASSQLGAEQEPVGRVSDLAPSGGRPLQPPTPAAEPAPAAAAPLSEPAAAEQRENRVEYMPDAGRVTTGTDFAPTLGQRNLAFGRTPTGASDASGLRLDEVGKGWEVYDNDQNSIGKVNEATPAFLHLKEGLIFKRDVYIPGVLVGSVDTEHQRVFLTQTKETIDDMDLSQPPSAGEIGEATGESTAWERVRAEEQPAAEGYVIEAKNRDAIDGPTHQPSVGPDYKPIRAQPTEFKPFTSPQEHNETTTDLLVNRAPDGVPFNSQEATIGHPIPPGAPSAGNRELTQSTHPEAMVHDEAIEDAADRTRGIRDSTGG